MKNKLPEWIDSFITSKFYDSCVIHHELRKNEMNIFCINCNECFCQHCIASSTHELHEQLQIRKYVYNNVVRVDVMQKYMDISGVQTYLSNNAKVIFVHPRPQLKTGTTHSSTACEVCYRFVQEDNRFCSIACKVSEVAQKERDKSPSPPLIQLPISENEVAMKENQDAEYVPKSSDQQQIESSSALKPTKRSHKRKGISRRSPLF
ncbi:protein RGF1 INDUCIBLE TRANSCRIPTION FACTOR 1-like [Telopea speciosissima]|uniref:protein RGF1 INDUCIBLE TRANSCRIPTION FACTOR 1-like n=1 Tax=Telopea speciosissima TaxID=54955 RepID=UPI001CC67276|nr:protein RGF1 INDUCIBLE TRANSCRIPTION FACTOR 1-like [Telopea speciosissima]